MKQVRWRRRPRDHASEATAWRGTIVGVGSELAFAASIETGAAPIAALPASGSTRRAAVLPGLPARLRVLAPERFERDPIQHLDLPQHVEVRRVGNAAGSLDPLDADDAEPTP